MMVTGIHVESDIWRRTANCQIVFHRIHNASLSGLDGLLGSAIRLAESNRELTGALWDLRLSVLQTLLPMGAPQLGVEEALGRFRGAKELERLRAEWEPAVKVALGQERNLKKDIVDDVFCSTEDIALWNRPWNRSPKGWPDATPDILERDYGDRYRVISGMRDLPEAGATVVLISPLWRHFPLASAVKLLRPGRWKAIHVLAYAVPLEDCSFTREVLASPSDRLGWSAAWGIQERTVGDPPQGGDTVHMPTQPLPYPDDEFDPGLIFGSDEPDAAEPVPACVVRLSSGGCVAYAIEDRVAVLNGDHRSLSVMELESGDLIPVAIDDGDRQGLEEAATMRLGQDNVSALKKRIGEWKQVLRVCLATYGEAKLREQFFRRVDRIGSTWREDAWSGDTPWAPRSKREFFSLLDSAKALGFFRDRSDMKAFAADCWRDVQALRNAHRLAGRELVNQLEDVLEQQVRKRQDWAKGEQIGLDDSNTSRKYVVHEVQSIHNAGLLQITKLRKLKKWQE